MMKLFVCIASMALIIPSLLLLSACGGAAYSGAGRHDPSVMGLEDEIDLHEAAIAEHLPLIGGAADTPCDQVCSAVQSICDAAERICEITASLGDLDSAGRCERARDACREAREEREDQCGCSS